jgi:hypothetical protein
LESILYDNVTGLSTWRHTYEIEAGTFGWADADEDNSTFAPLRWIVVDKLMPTKKSTHLLSRPDEDKRASAAIADSSTGRRSRLLQLPIESWSLQRTLLPTRAAKATNNENDAKTNRLGKTDFLWPIQIWRVGFLATLLEGLRFWEGILFYRVAKIAKK